MKRRLADAQTLLQGLQLSLPLLFGLRSEPVADPASAAAQAHPSATSPPPAPDTALDPTPEPASSPRLRRSQPPRAPAPAHEPPGMLLRHPRGSREVRLGDQAIGYELKRMRRRTIGFVIGHEGLSVSAPRWVGQAEIDAALQTKAAWILRKLADQGERARRADAARVDWRDGTTLPFLGETLVLVLDPRQAGVTLHDPARPGACADGGQPGSGRAAPGSVPGGVPHRTLHVGLPTHAAPAQIRDTVQGWLQRQALAIFEARCRHYAERLGVRVARLKLSSAQTRWGSASADGTVRLNWRLVHFSLSSIDYVVAHELAHLREMNHSPAFWEVVRSVMPDYEQRRGQLKDGQVPVFD